MAPCPRGDRDRSPQGRVPASWARGSSALCTPARCGERAAACHGVVASTPARSQQAAVELGAEANVRRCRRADRLTGDRRRAHLHAERPPPSARRSGAEAGKHVVCEKPLAIALDDARALCALADATGRVATVPFVYRFYPMVREARARGWPVLPNRPDSCTAATSRTGCPLPADDNWRVNADAGGRSRAFADIGSHWCDLVEFVTGDRIAALCAELVTAVPERMSAGERHAFASGAGRHGELRTVDTEDVALLLFRTARGVTGSLVVSQVSSGHKNQLRFEVAAPDATYAFDQEQPDVLWVGRRGSDARSRRATRSSSTRPRPRTSRSRPVIRRATRTASTRSSPTPTARLRPGPRPRSTGCRRSPTARGPCGITDAVLRSASAHQWVDVEVDRDPSTDSEEQR